MLVGINTYKPNKKKVARDSVIVVMLILGLGLLNPPYVPERFIVVFAGIASLMGIYFFIMAILPYLKITDTNEVEYRSDYGITQRIKLSQIKKVTIGSGLGGYEHALFVYHDSDYGEKRTKIKSSYFDKEDIIAFIANIKKTVSIETNEELEDYLAGRKRKYS